MKPFLDILKIDLKNFFIWFLLLRLTPKEVSQTVNLRKTDSYRTYKRGLFVGTFGTRTMPNRKTRISILNFLPYRKLGGVVGGRLLEFLWLLASFEILHLGPYPGAFGAPGVFGDPSDGA